MPDWPFITISQTHLPFIAVQWMIYSYSRHTSLHVKFHILHYTHMLVLQFNSELRFTVQQPNQTIRSNTNEKRPPWPEFMITHTQRHRQQQQQPSQHNNSIARARARSYSTTYAPYSSTRNNMCVLDWVTTILLSSCRRRTAQQALTRRRRAAARVDRYRQIRTLPSPPPPPPPLPLPPPSSPPSPKQRWTRPRAGNKIITIINN